MSSDLQLASDLMMGDVPAAHICRLLTGTEKCHPVILEDGNSPPRTEGTGYYFTSPSGKIIRHPSSYDWPKIYHASTLHTVVGERWISSRIKSGGYRKSNRYWMDALIRIGSR